MQFFKDIKTISQSYRGSVIAIGNFDGVHRGHQAVISQAKQLAKELSTSVGVLTFGPHPRIFFNDQEKPFLLYDTQDRRTLLSQQGIDFMIEQTFDASFAATSAQEMVEDYLCGHLDVAGVVVGRDYRFGRKRQGDVKYLQQMGAKYNFAVQAIEKIETSDGIVVSSTEIRKSLKEGQLDKVARLLGHRWRHKDKPFQDVSRFVLTPGNSFLSQAPAPQLI